MSASYEERSQAVIDGIEAIDPEFVLHLPSSTLKLVLGHFLDGAGCKPGRNLRSTHAADWKHSDARGKHGAQRLQVPRTVSNRRKKFQLGRPGTDGAERFRGRCDPGHYLHAHLQGTPDNLRIAIGRNDETAARRVRSANGLQIEHRTGPDEAVGPVSRRQRGNTCERIGRIERHFDDPNTRGRQHTCDFDDPRQLDAAQNGNERGFSCC